VAARLACGLVLATVGPQIDGDGLERIAVPELRRTRAGIFATAMLVDRFGNVTLNLRAAVLESANLGETVELITGGERYLARVARTFSGVRPSDIVILVDSYGQAAVAVNAGSASEVLGLEVGDEVLLQSVGRARRVASRDVGSSP
jgi:S-adenosyl-L-methionine hydrolase (adenosine-forming)